MRGVLDPKRFYKRSDKEGLPKYFQVPSQFTLQKQHFVVNPWFFGAEVVAGNDGDGNFF